MITSKFTFNKLMVVPLIWSALWLSIQPCWGTWLRIVGQKYE
jgi:hypothetical protein